MVARVRRQALRAVTIIGMLSGAVLAIHVAGAEAQPPFHSQWGTYGTGPGQFDHPFGITNDPAGFIYVTDLNNQRVQKFTSDGTFVRSWGSFGTQPGQFMGPVGIAWSPAGEIIVADHSNHRVCRFSTDGDLLGCFGGGGEDEGEFLYPVGVATDADGRIYVTESSNHRVQVFTPAGSFIRTWGSYGSELGQMIRPYGIVVDGTGDVFVAEHGEHRITGAGGGHRVQRFTSDGMFELVWGSEGVGDGQFISAEGLAIQSNGNVLVCDNANHRVQEFTRDGAFVTKWGTLGGGEGQFNEPGDVTIDPAGSIYITDGLNHRIQKFGTAPPAHHEPTITSVRDVPNDDGGQVHVRWTPSDLDVSGARVITGYRLWRRLPPEVSISTRAPRETWIHEGRIVCARAIPGIAGDSYWEAVATVPAEYLEGYGIASATPQDSTRRGNPYTAFFVSALTSDPFVFYQSEIDSGYSVDNRRPRKPHGPRFSASVAGNVIAWGANPEADLAGYRVYGGNMASFDPSGSTLIAEVPDTSCVVVSPGVEFFAVTAIDVHGNESEFAIAERAEAGLDPTLQLGPPVPNPARGTPVRLRYSIPRRGHVTATVTDLQGRTVLTLKNGMEESGSHDIVWAGADEEGRSVPTGIYFVRLHAAGRERMQRVVWMP